MGIVLQDPFLFNGTVRENIRFGRLEADDAEVEAAAKAVGAHDFITRLRQGYDTSVEEGGLLLSVGQRQLISFARALLADPRILILDEATSSVDTQTERIIQSALARLLKDRTAFVIAHRLSTVVNADHIVVIHGGRIVEQGTHAELLAQGGQYYRLYSMALVSGKTRRTATCVDSVTKMASSAIYGGSTGGSKLLYNGFLAIGGGSRNFTGKYSTMRLSNTWRSKVDARSSEISASR
jgi:ABC-type multidrug transport system ATPase subunit